MKSLIEAHPQTLAKGALPLWKPRPRWEGKPFTAFFLKEGQVETNRQYGSVDIGAGRLLR